MTCYYNEPGTRTQEIILGHVCPALGILFANYQNIAPLKDLHTAVLKGQGLDGLNPTPWIFMLGTTIAWTAYALLSNDYYLFFADCFGFLSCIWLNLGAVKLMYSDHHQQQTRKTLVQFLQKNDKEIEKEKKSIIEQKEMEIAEVRRTLIGQQLSGMTQLDLTMLNELEEIDENGNGSGDKGSEERRSTALEKNGGEDSEERISMGPRNEKKRRAKSSVVRFSTMLPRRSTTLTMDGDIEPDYRPSKVRISTMLPHRSTGLSTNDGEDTEQRSSMGDRESNSHRDSSRSSRSRFSSTPRRMSLMGSRRFSLVKTGSGSNLAKRLQKANHWADVVWKVTAQQEPAGASHEILLLSCVSFWLVVFCILFFYSYHDPRECLQFIPLEVIGYIGIGFQLFFYGAPLARIGHVLKTKKCDCIHMQSLVGNTLNNSLWTGYGLAPSIRDVKIWGPCAAGLVFCAIQFFLCAIFPRSTESEKVAKRFSISSLLLPSAEFSGNQEVRPSSTLGRDIGISEAMEKIREYEESSQLSLNDLESFSGNDEDQEGEMDYMSSFGLKSYLY